MRINFERQLTPDDALRIANATIESLGLTVDEKIYGDKYKTYHCRLQDSKNKSIFFGCGKGIGIQSKVSAYFEALEHYETHRFSATISQDKKNYLAFTTTSRNQLEQNQDAIPHVYMESSRGEQGLHYPLFLIDPRYSKTPSKQDHFDYLQHAWRASDTGIASGTHFLEASIHALNELVERDAYSIFLLKAFMNPERNKLSIIDKDSLPAYLQEMISDIESQYADNLAIFDITSDIGIPTLFVSMTKQNHLIQPKGCGTSLNSAYALERALLECLQPLHIYNQHAKTNQSNIVNNLSKAPLLQRCAVADVNTLIKQAEWVDFHHLSTYNSLALETQFQMIQYQIQSRGLDIYHSVISAHDSGFICVKYVVPGLEEFHMVQTGKFILPNVRGMKMANIK